MNYRNKLGMFTFDDIVQESHMKLIVQTITGQYLNPKPREPELTDEQSCYNYIMSSGGNVLAAIPFDLEINEDVRVWTKEQLVAKKIRDFDAKVKQIATTFTKTGTVTKEAIAIANQARNILLDPRPSFGGWLVGPAAVQ